MQAKLATAALCAFVLLTAAACGGGDEAQLRTDLAAAEEAAQKAAEAAEAAQKAAEEAEGKRKEEEAARKKAKEDADKAEEAKEEAEDAAADAEQKRQDAEAERQRLADEVEKAQQATNRAAATIALDGLQNRPDGAGTGDPTIIPKYRARSTLTTNPALSWGAPATSTSGKWFIEKYTHTSTSAKNELLLYSDVGGPTNVFMRSHADYSSDFDGTTGEPDADGIALASLSGVEDLVKASAFPSASQRVKPFEVNYDPNNPKTPDDATDDIVRIRNGSLQGASGDFHCSPIGGCSVKNRGDNTYALEGGTWTFHPRDKDVKVSQTDGTYMLFGWWKQTTVPAGQISYRTFVGGVGTVDANAFNAERGSATYRGPAIGQYALSHTLVEESSTGSFTAATELHADFTANTISGTIDNFSNSADWSLSLNERTMAGGAIAGGTVDWSIKTEKKSGGTWSGNFLSNDPNYSGGKPEGIRGKFSAAFGDDGQIIGVFGAHKP